MDTESLEISILASFTTTKLSILRIVPNLMRPKLQFCNLRRPKILILTNFTPSKLSILRISPNLKDENHNFAIYGDQNFNFGDFFLQFGKERESSLTLFKIT